MASRDIFLVSPHCDDVAYSLGGRLAAKRLPLDRCELLTVFTASPYCPLGSFRPEEVAKITELRLAEDREFCRRLGIAHFHYHLPEATLRSGYARLEDVRVSRSAALRDPILGTVCSLLTDLRQSRDPSYVFVPVAIGGHADHWIVRVACEFVFEGEKRLVYYEDLPYAGYISEEDLEGQLKSISGTARGSILPESGWLGEKLALLRTYRCQVSDCDVNAVIMSTTRIGGERIWLPEGVSLSEL
jgi:GlcNAc-PI de-N-acetylase